MDTKKIVLIGGTGNVGVSLTNQLLGANCDLYLASRSKEKVKDMFSKVVPVVEFDYNNPDTFDNLKGFDSLFFISPPINQETLSVTNRLIRKVKEYNITHAVLMSSALVKYDAELPLAKIENQLINSGLNYTIVRPNWFMQNFHQWAATTAKDGFFALPAGKGKVSFIDVSDIALVVKNVLLKPETYINKTITLTGSELLSHFDVAKILEDKLNNKVEYYPVQAQEYIDTLVKYGQDEGFAKFMAYILGFISSDEEGFLTNVVKEITGKEPLTFNQYVKDNIQKFM